MGTLFLYEGDVYVDLALELEVRDDQDNELDCEVECDGHDRQITVTLDPRYKINDTENKPTLEDINLSVLDANGQPAQHSVNIDNDLSEITVTLEEVQNTDCHKVSTYRIEDEQARLYIQGVDIEIKKAGEDNILVIPAKEMARLKADIREELIAELTTKLFS